MAHIILGTDDSVTTCDCCGKSNLKHTVIVSVDGEVRHYGSTCATRHTGMRSSQIDKAIQTIADKKIEAARTEYTRSIEYIAHAVKLAQATRAKIQPGKPFMEYCRTEFEAAAQKAREVAAAHGVEVYKIN